MDLERNKAVVQRFDDVITEGDPDELDELCTPDLVNHALAATRPAGLAGTKEFLTQQSEATSRERGRGDPHASRWASLAVIAENDLVVQYGAREGNWPGGFFRGFQIPSGRYTREAAFMYRLVDFRIAERWAVRDDLGMMLQLGALSPRANRARESTMPVERSHSKSGNCTTPPTN
jgi:hypothetical protein